MIDTTTVSSLVLGTGEISGLIVLIVQRTKFLIPEGPKQNDEIRLMSTLLGGIFVCLYQAVTTHPTAPLLLSAFAEGLTLGAGITYAVKGVKQIKVTKQNPLPSYAEPTSAPSPVSDPR